MTLLLQIRVLPRTYYSQILAEALGPRLVFECSLRPDKINWKYAVDVAEILEDPGVVFLEKPPNPTRMDHFMVLPEGFHSFMDFDKALFDAVISEHLDWLKDGGVTATKSAAKKVLGPTI